MSRHVALPICLVLACLVSCKGKKKAAAVPEVAAGPAYTPLYRFWDSRVKEHLYTYEGTEPVAWRAAGNFGNEHVVGYAVNTPEPGTVRLWRAYCKDGRHYFYIDKPATANDIERIEDFLLYVWTQPGDGRVPVHASYLPNDKDPLFDTNLEAIRQNALDTQRLTGVARKVVESVFYVLPQKAGDKTAAPTIDPTANQRPPKVLPPRVPTPEEQLATELPKLERSQRVVFSRDGRRLATVARAKTNLTRYALQTWDLATGRTTAKLWYSNDDPSSPTFSPDGKQLAAIVPFKREILVWDLEGGLEPKRFPTGDDPIQREFLRFPHDGTSLYFAKRELNKLSLASGSISAIPAIPFVIGDVDVKTILAVSPTGPHVVFQNHKRVDVFTVVNTETGETTHCKQDEKGFIIQNLAFSGDGSKLIANRVDFIEVWDARKWQLVETLRRPGVGDRDSLSYATISGDGSIVTCLAKAAVADPRTRPPEFVAVWNGTKFHQFPCPEESYAPIPSPDGRLILMTNSHGPIRILDAATGQPKSIP